MRSDWTATTGQRWPDQRRGPWNVRCHWRAVAGRVELVGMEVEQARPTEPPRVLGAQTWRQVYGQVAVQRVQAARLFAAAAADPHRSKQDRAAAAEVVAGLKDAARPTRRLYDASHWSDVARVYSEARNAERHDAAAAVAAALGLSPSQGRNHVRRARELGYLPPAEQPRKAGPAVAQPRQPKSKPPAPAAPTARKGRKA